MRAPASGQAMAALPYFQQLQAPFVQRLSHFLKDSHTSVPLAWLDSLPGLGWQSFELSVAAQSEGLPPVDCHRGCATCCSLRVGDEHQVRDVDAQDMARTFDAIAAMQA
jgi:hypothetical protein